MSEGGWSCRVSEDCSVGWILIYKDRIVICNLDTYFHTLTTEEVWAFVNDYVCVGHKTFSFQQHRTLRIFRHCRSSMSESLGVHVVTGVSIFSSLLGTCYILAFIAFMNQTKRWKRFRIQRLFFIYFHCYRISIINNWLFINQWQRDKWMEVFQNFFLPSNFE